MTKRFFRFDVSLNFLFLYTWMSERKRILSSLISHSSYFFDFHCKTRSFTFLSKVSLTSWRRWTRSTSRFSKTFNWSRTSFIWLFHSARICAFSLRTSEIQDGSWSMRSSAYKNELSQIFVLHWPLKRLETFTWLSGSFIIITKQTNWNRTSYAQEMCTQLIFNHTLSIGIWLRIFVVKHINTFDCFSAVSHYWVIALTYLICWIDKMFRDRKWSCIYW